MTILVTGANGALGRVLGASLRLESEEVVLAGRQELDVTNEAAVAEGLERFRPRLIFHLAGSFSHDYGVDYAVNALGAYHLLQAIHRNGYDTRVVVCGSAAEYGLVRRDENPVSEQRVLVPISIYGVTKASQTQIAGYHAHTLGCDVVVARLFNLLAPGLSARLFVGRVERFIESFKRGEATVLEVGNLDSERDYVGAGDAVSQMRTIAARGETGGIYHVGSGRPIRMRELLRQTLDAAGIPGDVVREGVPAAGGRTGYDAPSIVADMSRTRALGGALT